MKNLKPITRREMFMAKAAGQDVTPPEPITREEMFLSDIAEHEEGQGGGGGLPTVTSDDNGNVLTVVEGQWAKAQPSGGGVFYVGITSTYDGSTGTTSFSVDRTYAQIKQAFEDGQFVIGRETADSANAYTGMYYDFKEILESNGSGEAKFVRSYYEKQEGSYHYDIMIDIVIVNSDDTVSSEQGNVESAS